MDKGRLVLEENEMDTSFRRMNNGWLIAFTWIFGFLFLFAGTFFEGALNMLIAFVPGVLLILSGLAGAYLTTKIRTISLYENGINNLRVSYTTVRFTEFDEIESADIFARSADMWSMKERATIVFWVRGRRFKPFNPLYLKDEDARKDKLAEIVRFLKSRGVKVNLTGQADEWLSEDGDQKEE